MKKMSDEEILYRGIEVLIALSNSAAENNANGRGDYTRDRHQWLDGLGSMNDIVGKLKQRISKEYGRLNELRKERHDLTRMHDMERDLNNFIDITVPHLQQDIRALGEKIESLKKLNESLRRENEALRRENDTLRREEYRDE
jgi:cell division protein FtsB